MAPRKALPKVEQDEKALPTTKQTKKDLPKPGNPENCITIGDQLIEIKPTKLKYHRNRTAAFYKVLDMYPLPDVIAMREGAFGDDRDGDKATFDWLIAVFDDADLVSAHYDDMDTETIERILAIYRRINKIDEKDEKLKNRTAPTKGA